MKKEETETAIYVLSRNSGEGKDREYRKGDYLLTDREIENLKFLAETMKRQYCS